MKRYLIGAFLMGCFLGAFAQEGVFALPGDHLSAHLQKQAISEQVQLQKVFSLRSSTIPVYSIALARENEPLRVHTLHFQNGPGIKLEVDLDAVRQLLQFKWTGIPVAGIEYCLQGEKAGMDNWQAIPTGENAYLNLRNFVRGDYYLQFRDGEKKIFEKYLIEIR